MVYEQADSLKPAAEKYKLTVQTSGLVCAQWQGACALRQRESSSTAVFSDDAVKNKRNTDAVDVGKGVLVAARSPVECQARCPAPV
jgi:peptidyl-prolyl cis-trans isomerase D